MVYKPTKLGELCYKHRISPVLANMILLEFSQSGDIECGFGELKKMIDELRLYGIANEVFPEGSYEVRTGEEYKRIKEYEESEDIMEKIQTRVAEHTELKKEETLREVISMIKSDDVQKSLRFYIAKDGNKSEGETNDDKNNKV